MQLAQSAALDSRPTRRYNLQLTARLTQLTPWLPTHSSLQFAAQRSSHIDNEHMFAGELLVKTFNERMFAELAYANHSLHSPLTLRLPVFLLLLYHILQQKSIGILHKHKKFFCTVWRIVKPFTYWWNLELVKIFNLGPGPHQSLAFVKSFNLPPRSLTLTL